MRREEGRREGKRIRDEKTADVEWLEEERGDKKGGTRGEEKIGKER